MTTTTTTTTATTTRLYVAFVVQHCATPTQQ